MSFESRIAALKANGTLVIGWRLGGGALISDIQRVDGNGLQTHYVEDPNMPFEGPSLRSGWITGADTDVARGAEGGLSNMYFPDMVTRGYGSAGVTPLFTLGDTMSLQYGVRMTPSFIGVGSQVDRGWRGGCKDMMFEMARGEFEGGTMFPAQGSAGGNFHNTPIQMVINLGTSPISTVANRHPGAASLGFHHTAQHLSSSSPTVNNPAGSNWLRPDLWCVITMTMNIGATWVYRPQSWMSTSDPSHPHYILNDYRLTDARWVLSSAQTAAYNSGDAAALRSANYNTASKPHRLRIWMQWEDWAEPLLVKDSMLGFPGQYEPKTHSGADPTQTYWGLLSHSTLLYKAGKDHPDQINWYGQRYTPFLNGLRSGIDVFPNPEAGPAEWRISKWWGPLILAREEIEPKFYDGADPGDPPPMSTATMPSSMNVRFA